MRHAYLLNWKLESKPGQEPTWPNYRECARRLRSGDTVVLSRDFGKRKAVERGARVYVVKQGKSPTGIVASGFVVGDAHPAEHFRGHRVASAADVRFDYIVDVGADQRPMLVSAQSFPGPHWDMQSSGVDVSEYAEEIERRWLAHLEAIGLRQQ
jgi:hypothetical protein